MKHLFVINGKAGKGKGLDLIPAIEKLFQNRNDQYAIKVTERAGHGEGLAREAAVTGKHRVYAVGGDGTVNEVLNGIVNTDSSLAVIPVGSGNDFFRCIGQMGPAADLLKRTVEGREKPADIARVNDRYFINISSVGLDAEAAWHAENMRKIPYARGFSYILGAVRAILGSRPQNVQLWLDNICLEEPMLFTAVANGRYYGRGMIPVPEARIDDGLLDVCFIKPMTRTRMFALFPKYMKGKHGDMPEVSFYKVKKLIFTSDSDIALNVDGQVSRTKQAVFEIIPAGINLVYPK